MNPLDLRRMRPEETSGGASLTDVRPSSDFKRARFWGLMYVGSASGGMTFVTWQGLPRLSSVGEEGED